MRFLTCCAALMSIVSPATASGGLWCEADDARVQLSVQSGITRGLGNPLFDFRGTLEIRDSAVAADLRKSTFDIGNLTQHWLDGKDLKMQLYRERGGDGPVGEVDLTIETRMVDEGSYEGAYVLRISDMTGVTTGEPRSAEFDGKIACGAD